MELTDRGVVITGGGSGLGRATAEVCADAGARVAVLDLDGRAANAVADELGGGAFGLEVDVTDPGATTRAVDTALDELGEVHVCVNAAGVATAGVITDGRRPIELDRFREVIEVNLIGAFDVMRLCADAMTANRPIHGERGVIVNVSSGAAWQGQRGQAAYAASKAALLGLTLPVARDLAEHAVRVLAIAPGLFDTSMARGLPAHVHDRLLQMALHPKRLGDPREFALLVRHIVENPYLNATTISVDAGIRMT